MILITGTFRIPSGALARARPAMERMIAASRAEAGCLEYSYAPDLNDETLIRVTERWTSRGAFEDHVASPHLAEWRAAFGELGITDRSLKLFEVDEGESI
ncbi:MAG: antibiotic biosynthesis monooxygenase [Erythrobacter sp.]|nr:antibiotic biosynthesis monooxygenase [Erythrobacter sp.]